MNRLKTLRKNKNLSQKELADILFVNQTAVSQWERGATSPNPTTLNKLADFFNVSTDYLLNREEPSETKKSPKRGVKIPVLGYVAAGIPIDAIEDIIDYEEIPESMAKTGEFFGLKIKGDSMEPRICEGDVVIVKKQPNVESGDIAVVIVNGDSGTCKKIMKYEDGISLISFNPVYPPKFFKWNEIEELPITFCGKVVELRGKF